MLNLFSLNIKKIRTSYTKRTITSNSISLVFTNDILIIFISPINFWNLTKKMEEITNIYHFYIM